MRITTGSPENFVVAARISLQKGYYWYDSFGRESSPTWRLFFKQVGGRWNMQYESIHSDVWFLSMYNPWLLLVHKDQQRLVKFTTSSNLISDALNSKSLMTVLWFSWLVVESLTICTMIPVWNRHHLIRFLTIIRTHFYFLRCYKNTHTRTSIHCIRCSIQKTNTFFQKRPRCLNKNPVFRQGFQFHRGYRKNRGPWSSKLPSFLGWKHQRMMGFGELFRGS